MLRSALLAGAATAFTLLALLFLKCPYAWFLPCWAIVFIVVARNTRGGLRVVAGNIAAILFILAGFEIALCHRQEATRLQAPLRGRLARPDPILGYAADPSSIVRDRLLFGGKAIYDAIYTVDANGLRVAPPAPARDAVLFFGCSQTFGVGVADGETFASQMQSMADGRVRTLNFAFRGYGPHQMLRQLETNRERVALADARPIAGVYFAIPDHIRRAAGRALWETNAPRYEVNARGEAVFAGMTGSRPLASSIGRRINSQLRKSALYSLLADNLPTKSAPADLDRFVAIVAAAKRTFEQRYGAPFLVISAWEGFREKDLVEGKLRERGLTVIPIKALVPDFEQNTPRYTIPHDSHFNAAAHRAIARGLARELRLIR